MRGAAAARAFAHPVMFGLVFAIAVATAFTNIASAQAVSTRSASAASAGSSRLPPSSPFAAVSHIETLKDMGFADGVSLQGTQGERDLFFALPLRESAVRPRLRVDVQFASTLQPSSGVTILFNGVPQAAVARRSANADGWTGVDLAVQPEFLRSDYLRVTMRYSLVNDRDVCVDQRLGQGFIKVGPNTGLHYDVPANVSRTVSGAWALLPNDVSIGVPRRALSTAEFESAYMLAVALQRRGHTITIDTIGRTSGLVIASPSEMRDAHVIGTGSGMKAGSSVEVIEGADGRLTLALIAQHDIVARELLNRRWESTVGSTTVDIVNEPARSGRQGSVSFADLDIPDLKKIFTQEASWSIPISLREMPHRRRPARLRLHVVSSGPSKDEKIVLNAYLNGTLIQSAQLVAGGEPETVVIDLPPYLIETYNDVRITAQRQEHGGACNLSQGAYPLQIMSSSAVETDALRGDPRGFRDLALMMDDSVNVYVDRELAANPVRVLRQLVHLSKTFWNDDLVPVPHIIEANARLSPSHSFVLFSRRAPKDLEAPLRISGNQLQLRAVFSDPVLMNLSRLDRWTVVQTAALNKQHGLWIAPADQEPQLDADLAGLGTEDISLVDPTGRTFRFHSTEREVFDLSGAQRAGFLSSLGSYRLPLFILGWVLATALITYLAVLTQRHRQ